jgi:hypothetical protein
MIGQYVPDSTAASEEYEATFLVSWVVSMGRCNTTVEPDLP